MVRMVGGVKPVVTPWGFKLRSSTSIIKNALAIPPSAMAYHGFREALKGIVEVLNGPAAGRLADLYEAQEHTPEALEELLKSMGITPNTSRDAAGDRGTKAHDVVELLALEWNRGQVVDENDVHGRATTRDWAEALAEDELRTEGTRYGYAGIEWWDTEIQPWIDSGEILDVVSERPVWDYPCADCGKEGYAGTLDLGILWGTAGILPGGVDGIRPIGWEIIDRWCRRRPAWMLGRRG